MDKKKQIKEQDKYDEEDFRDLLDEITNGVAIYVDGNNYWSNKAYAEIFGYTKEELVGTEINLLADPDEASVLVEKINNDLDNNDNTPSYKTIGKRKDGERINIEVSIKKTTFDGKQAIRALVRDFTKRTQLEENLLESEEQYRNVVELANDGIAIIQDTIIQYVNPRAMDILGYTPEEMCNTSMSEFIHPDEMENALDRYTRRMAGESVPSLYETVFLHKEGHGVDVEVSARSITYKGKIADLVVIRNIEERKHTEEALAEKDELFKTLIEHSKDAISIIEADGSTRYQSPSIERMFGYQDERDKSLTEFVHPDDLETISETFAELLQNNGSAITSEVRIKHGDGSWRDIEVFARNLLDNPAVKGIVTNFTDITERKQADEVLRNQEEHYRALIENTLDATIMIDAQGTMLYASPSYTRILGYEWKQAVGKRFFDHIHPDDLPELSDSWVQLKVNHWSTVVTQVRARHLDGSWMHIEVIGHNLLDHAALKAIVVNFRDITDRKEAEEALSRRTQLILAMQKVNTSIQSTLEVKEVLQLVSEAAVINLGYDHSLIFLYEESLNVNRSTVFFTTDADERIKNVEKILDQPLTTIEVPIIRGFNIVVDDSMDRKETIVYQLSDIAEPLFSKEQCDATQEALRTKTMVNIPFHAKDKLIGSMLVFTEREAVTEIDLEALWLLANQAAIAIENAKLNEDLEQRVEQRTNQLEAANKELESFAYSVSHDLRAPLRAIDGFSQMLIEDYGDALDDQGKDYINRVSSGVKRMTELIDGILDLSRLTRGELNMEPVNLSELAESIAEELKQIQPDRQVDFVIPPSLVVDGDERLLRAVLENLMRNSWKFTGKHDTAMIELGYTENTGKPVYFLKDDGAGFDMLSAQKLFGTFQRLHTASEFEGTGIGLATVQRIINRHGGEVWAESAVEEGATFYFTL